MTAYGPQTAFGEEIHSSKHRLPGESFREQTSRIANALKDDDVHYHQFRDIIRTQRFMPGGRIQSAMGAPKAVTPYNCYVSGTIADSFLAGDGSIMQRLAEAAETMRQGGGIGYDFSTLRPHGALIKSLQSTSSGPVAFMDIFSSMCLCIMSAGHRRGAMMGMLRIDHPDIEEFIRAKQNETRLRGFNLSIAVTDEFMECLSEQRPFPLRFNGQAVREVDPVALWEMVMRSTWDWAEPGVIFIDTINRMNNLYYCETIAATNPCGEQPLPPFGACLLGSFNLAKYVAPAGGGLWAFDWEQLEADIPPVVRAMDNVVDRARYPLPGQQREARSKRRMGLGVCGLANAGEALGMPYGSAEFLRFEAAVLTAIRDGAYRASALLAKEKGPFPMFDDRYNHSSFVRTLPDDVRRLIKLYGIRNSHLTSIAPTGTISLGADNTSSGIEPVFDLSSDRKVMMPDGQRVVTVEDYGLRFFGVRGKTCDRVTAQEHIDVLATAAGLVDSAVSKTCNFDGGVLPWDDFKGLYTQAWERGAKGCTTFNKSGRRAGILTSTAPAEGASCQIDPTTGVRSCE